MTITTVQAPTALVTRDLEELDNMDAKEPQMEIDDPEPAWGFHERTEKD